MRAFEKIRRAEQIFDAHSLAVGLKSAFSTHLVAALAGLYVHDLSHDALFGVLVRMDP